MVPAETDLRIKLPVFEGPLDLLLFLIRKNELDIYDIPISTVTKQYIAVLRSMQQLDLEIAGEFFVMAASLMEIKSRMLLPRGQAATGESEDDDPLDPRWELVHQLLQYKKFKEAAAKLDELASFQRDMLPRLVVEVAVTENERPLKPVDRIELWNSFNLVLRRLSEKLVVGEIKGEEVTVSDKMEELLKLIETRKKFLFTDLFEGQAVTVRLLVATFIAVLELTRLKKLRVRQDEAYADIFVEAVEDTHNADGSLAEGQLNFSPDAPEQTSRTPGPLERAPSVEPASDSATASAATTAAAAAAIASTRPSDSDSDSDPDPDANSEADYAPTPDLVLSATGYATIPSVRGAAPSEPGDAPVPFAEAAPPPAADDEPEPSSSPATAPSAEPEAESSADSVAALNPSPDLAPSPEPETAPEPAPAPASDSTPEPTSPSEPATPLTPAAEAAAAEQLAATISAAEPPAPFEPAPSPPSDEAPPPAEQIPPQNPLDNEPPRNTLTS